MTALLRFGIIADPQYAPAPPRRTRYFANSLWKLAEAIEALNAQELAFVVTLGDLIDHGAESFLHVLPLYERLRHEHRFVLGNHDFDVRPDQLSLVPHLLGLGARYYDFAHGGVRFVVLDGTEISLFANPPGSPRHEEARAMLEALRAEGAIQAKEWNGALSEAQFAWLAGRLAAAATAGESVVVLNHYPVHPENVHNLLNAGKLVDLLSSAGNVIAHLSGHDHDGGYGMVGGVHCVTLEGMVETATEAAWGTVAIHPERIVIEGAGRLTSRVLALQPR